MIVSDSDYLKQLDIIRNIRDIITTKDEINLPQICVIGDQSSGKSSFLSRLTGVSFPTAAKMCTKAATVVTCNRDTTIQSPTYEIEEWENPGKYRSITSTAEAIQETQDKMLQSGDNGCGGKDENRIIKDKAIKLRVSSPTVIDIIIVDLPGIQHAGPTKEDIDALIEENIKKPETLNLIVSEAKQDVELNKAIELAEKYDPDHERTIRVLSKFDNFDTPDTQQRAVSLIREGLNPSSHSRGISHQLNLGPHAVISVGKDGKLRDNQEGEEEEKKQLVERYKVPESRSGIASLKERLQPLFAALIKNNLPALKKKVADTLNETQLHLGKVGKEPLSPEAVTFRCCDFLKERVKDLETRLTNDCILEMKEEILKVKGKLTYEMVTSGFKLNALHCVLFQGQPQFDEAAKSIRELWEPIVHDFLKNTLEVVLGFVHCLHDDEGTKIYGRLISVIQTEYQEHMKLEVFPKFREACFKALDDENFYGTNNHYFDAKFREEEICPKELSDAIAQKVQKVWDDESKTPQYPGSTGYRYFNMGYIEECINEAKAEVASNQVHTNLLENQKKRLFSAVNAHFDVEKKTFVDILLKKTKGILVKGHSVWVEKHFLRSAKILEAAKEDESVTQLRATLSKKVQRLEECMKLLHDVPLPATKEE